MKATPEHRLPPATIARRWVKPATSPGEHLLEVDITLEELAQILGEELELPKIQPKGTKKIQVEKDKYSAVRRTGPESLRHFKRTYKEALKRQITSGIYNHRNPLILPIREDKRFLSWKTKPTPECNALIVYMMDVSGSMGDEQKEIVRIETFWIDTWLRSQYKGLVTRYIVHDAVAKEVNEEQFYHIARERRHDDLLGLQLFQQDDRRGIRSGAVEHLWIPFLRRRQLVGR